MRRVACAGPYAPVHQVVINWRSPLATGLVGAWLGNASRLTNSIRDLVNHNDAAPLGTLGTNWGWQESDNELGTGIYQPGDGGNTFDCGNGAALQIGTAGLTVSAWVRLYQNAGSSGFPGFIGKGNADSTAGSYILYTTSAAKLNWIDYSGGARADQLTGTTVMDWQGSYHIAATWQPSTRCALFLNGRVEVETTSSVPATLDNPAYNFLIGSMQGGTNKLAYCFRGNIFEVRLYNRAFSNAEIRQLFNPLTRWNIYRAPERTMGRPAVAPPAGALHLMTNEIDLTGLTRRMR